MLGINACLHEEKMHGDANPNEVMGVSHGALQGADVDEKQQSDTFN